MQAKDAFRSLGNAWEIAIGYDPEKQAYESVIVRNESGNHGDSRLVYPFKGYWVRANATCTYTAVLE